MIIRKYISIMTVIDTNETYKKLYYKYILYIIGVKHRQSFKTMGYNYDHGLK